MHWWHKPEREREGGGAVATERTHKPQIGDIWEYTFAPNVLPQYMEETKVTCHLLILDILNEQHDLYLCQFLETGYKSEVVMMSSPNMIYQKVA